MVPFRSELPQWGVLWTYATGSQPSSICDSNACIQPDGSSLFSQMQSHQSLKGGTKLMKGTMIHRAVPEFAPKSTLGTSKKPGEPSLYKKRVNNIKYVKNSTLKVLHAPCLNPIIILSFPATLNNSFNEALRLGSHVNYSALHDTLSTCKTINYCGLINDE